jgi:hypothetical protein
MLLLLLVLAAQLQPGNGSHEFRQPQLAAGPDQVVVTFGSGTAIYFASSDDGGHRFSLPVKVANPTVLALGRHRGPRVNLLPGAIVISAVVDRGNLVSWRSTDRGKTWTGPAAVTDTPGAAQGGFHAISSDQHGNLYAAWLDSRASGARVYGSQSKDGGLTWSRNVQIYASPDGTVCDCCTPSVAIDEGGEIWVMFRNVLDGDRDLYLTHSTDGLAFAPAQRLGLGSWPLDACPMDGGGLVAAGGHIVSAWRREEDLFIAEPGHPEYRMGQGKDVAITVSPSGTYVMWSGAKGLRVWKTGAETSVAIGREGAYPALITLPDGAVLAAWEHNGAIEIEKIP